MQSTDLPSTSTRVPVSVLIPTKNEEGNLRRCLDHLRWADEVVVVDSNSTDQTRQIAEAYGARVIDFTWNGQWPKKKNWALRNIQFRNDWVLIVDADEWIMPDLSEEIARTIRTPDKVGYYINRKFIFMGRLILHCGYYPSWNLRLIKRKYGEYEQLTTLGDTGSGDNEVHEHVVVNGPAGYMKGEMLHFAFPTVQIFIEKHNRYSGWEAAVELHNAKTAVSGASGNKSLARRRWIKKMSRRLPFRPTLRFLYGYVLRRGFLDGRPGYVLCRLLAIYEFLAVAKFHELRRLEEDRRKAFALSNVPSLTFGTDAGNSKA